MKPVRLLWLLVIVALGWSAWWGWSAWRAKAGLEAWLEARREAGWQAEWDSVRLRGYPTRLDRTIIGLTLADTEGGWVWSAPFFQILGLSYQPDHLILVWPGEMSLQTTEQRIALTGEDLKGSVTFHPGPSREVNSATLVFKGLALNSDAGWHSAARELRLAARPGAGAAQYEIALEAIGLRPGGGVVGLAAEAGLAPPEVELLKADLEVTFDRPWDRQAVEQARPQPRAVEIREIAGKWGAMELRIAGDLRMESDGQVSGDVMIKSTNWREMLDLAQDTGALPEALHGTVEAVLNLLSGLTGRADTLDIPLTFADGRTRIGPVPVGPAPVLRLP